VPTAATAVPTTRRPERKRIFKSGCSGARSWEILKARVLLARRLMMVSQIEVGPWTPSYRRQELLPGRWAPLSLLAVSSAHEPALGHRTCIPRPNTITNSSPASIQAGMDGTAVRMSGGPALIIPITS
jgi:hypothetical protein